MLIGGQAPLPPLLGAGSGSLDEISYTGIFNTINKKIFAQFDEVTIEFSRNAVNKSISLWPVAHRLM